MPSNLFGRLKPNQLLAALQQEPTPYGLPTGQMRGQQPEAPPVPPQDLYKGPVLPPTNFMPSKGQQKQGAAAMKDVADAMPDISGGLGRALGTSGAAVVEGDPAPQGAEDARKIMFGAKPGPMMEIPEGYGEPKPSALDQYISDQFAAPAGAEGPSLTGKFDISKLGAAAAEMEKKKLARRSEFESTPELDKLIASTQGQLDQAKSERKKPGLGEFLTLALMNLGNRDHRNNADMVLGTGEQREKEQRLESLLNHLQGSKASAQMQGRREMHSTDQQNRYRDLQAAMKKAEMQQKQSNFDQKLQFDKNQAGVNLLRQLSGQDAQIEGQTMDTKTREAAAKRRAKLLQTLGPLFSDPGGMETMKKAPPKDERQSRLFGDFIGGGGYA